MHMAAAIATASKPLALRMAPTIVAPIQPALAAHCPAALRRDGRVAEGARLESVYTGNRIVGSNPTPSATAGIQGRSSPYNSRRNDL